MKHAYARIIPLTALAALLAACGQQTAPQSANEPKPETKAPPASTEPMPQDMPMPKSEAAQGQQHSAMGTISSIDASAGTVTIAHEAVASAGWPAMTMTFKLADPTQAAALHANDKVHFTFTLGEKGDATVTMIMPADQGM